MTIYSYNFLQTVSKISAVVACVFTLSACQTPNDEVRVLEKSRQVEPEWLALGGGLHSSADGIDYIVRKDKVLDLPLGLTQAESSVLHNLKFQLSELIMGQINTNSWTVDSRRDLKKQLSQIMEVELNQSNLKDFYFDKISVPQAENELIPEYYRVYALAHVTSKQHADIANRIRKYIKTSPHAAIRSKLDSFTRF